MNTFNGLKTIKNEYKMTEEQLYNYFKKNRFKYGDFYTIEFKGKSIGDKDTCKLFAKMKELNKKVK